MTRRLGIFGGSFDPPHVAHIALAQHAIEQFALDELRIIPTGDAWHKTRTLTASPHRLAMTRLAFAHVPQAVVDTREIDRLGATYTIDPAGTLPAGISYNSSTGAWSVDTGLAAPTSGTLGTFPDGRYPVTATTTDAAGNATSDASTNELRIDTTSLTVALTSPNGTTYTNEGATAEANFVLPTAVASYIFTFICQDADGIKVTAASGDTIRLGANVSAAAGNVASTTIGSSVTLVSINATEWMATSIVGTWVVT